MDLPKHIPPAILQALATASERHSVPLRLLVGLAWVESRFNPSAGPSSAGAMGLLQLMPGTARALGVGNAYDPNANADAGARFVAQLYRQFMSWERALAAYNWGPGNVRQRPDPQEWPATVRRYVWRVHQAGQHCPIPFPGQVWITPLVRPAHG